MCARERCNSFSPHLILDLEECNADKLGDLNFIFNFLNNFPEQINMTRITQPIVFPYIGKNLENRGITGIVFIAESHISIHTFIEKKYAFVDIFSCKPYDIKKAKEIVINLLESKNTEMNFVKRGSNFQLGKVKSYNNKP